MSTVRKSRLFMAWQDGEEEAWLDEMSAKGLHLQQVKFPCFYYFTKGEPSAYVYRLDFKSSPRGDMDEYMQLFADAGWEHVGQFFNGWQYFRKKNQPSEEMEIYSDVESKIAKYNRLILFLVPFVPLLIFSLITTSAAGMLFMQVLDVLLLIIYTVAMVKLMQRVKNLKSQF